MIIISSVLMRAFTNKKRVRENQVGDRCCRRMLSMVSLRRACVARVTAVGFACLCVGRLESKHLTSRMSHGAINRLMNMRAWWHTNVKTICLKRLCSGVVSVPDPLYKGEGLGRGSGNIPIVDLCSVYSFSSGCKINT